MKNGIVVAVSFLAFTNYCWGSEDEKYEVKLSRPHKVGDVFEYSRSISEKPKVVVSIDGKVQPKPDSEDTKNSETVSIEAVIEIQEVEDGRVKKCLAIVNELAEYRDGKKDLLVGRGVRLSVVFGEDTANFELDSKPVDAEMEKVLLRVFRASGQDPFSKIFKDSDVKRAVGEKWEIDSQVAADAISDRFLDIAPENIQARMSVESIVVRDGIRCLKIRGEVDINDASIGAPKGFKQTSSSVTARFSGLFPIDNVTQCLERSITLSISSTGSKEEKGKVVELQRTVEGAGKQTITPRK